MSEMYLDDVRGYWGDLAAPAFEEFWSDYQADREINAKHVLLVYRRLIASAFFMNHLSDKAALMYGLKKGNLLISKIKESDSETAAQLDACRNFVNDAKHEMKRIQEASLRARVAGFDNDGDSEVLQFHMLSIDGEHLFDLCSVVCAVWRFWIAYFDGTAVITHKGALAHRFGTMNSSPGSL